MISRIENRIAVLDKDLNIIPEATTKEFFAYFDFRCSSLPEFVHEDDRQKFIDLMAGEEDGRQAIMRFLRNTGAYKYSLVTVTKAASGTAGKVQLLEIDDVMERSRHIRAEYSKIRKILSITNEYMFSYNSKSNMLKIVHYDQGHAIISYYMDLDEWAEQILEEGIVPDSEKHGLEILVYNLKDLPSSFTQKLVCGIRTGTSVTEHLRFMGVRHNDPDEDAIFIVGRILSEETSRQMHHARSLIGELQIDPLTQVYNKKTITATIQQRIKAGGNERFALVIVDMDKFKPVNDQYGHMAGDRVLSRAAERMKEVVGEDGMVGRIGGDEFMLILDGVENDQILRGMLRAVLVQIRKEFEGNFEGFNVTCSIGAAVYPTNGTTYDELFQKADFGLYIAKDKGRDRYVFFRDDLHAERYAHFMASKSAGQKTESREIQELKYMTQFAKQLTTDRDGAILSIMRHMLGTYGMDCISIYLGEKMERVLCVGMEREEFSEASYVHSDDFKKLLCEGKYIKISFSDEISKDSGAFRTAMLLRGIGSTIQCIIGTPDNIRGMVSFDRVHAPAQWADYEVSCAVMFTSILDVINFDGIK